MAAKLLDRRRPRRCDASVGAVAFRAGSPLFRVLMPTLSYLQFAQLRSLLLVSVLPALSMACNHPSTGGSSSGVGGFENNSPGGSTAGHSGNAGANGSG